MTTRWTTLLLVLPLLALSACPRYPKPEDATSIPTELVDALEARSSSIRDLRISAKAEYWDFKNNERVAGRDVVVSARRPGFIRLTLSSFDKALATLVSDGLRFAMLDTQQTVYYEGPATAYNLSRIIPLYLSSPDFVRVLLGSFPQDELAPLWRQEAVLGWNDEEGRYRLDLPRIDNGTLRIEATHPQFELSRLEILDAKGNTLYVFKATQFEKIGDTSLARVCRFEIVERELDVTLRIEKADINIDLQDRVFELPIPPGFELITLE